MKISSKNCKIVIFFGGPSNERNISLDSARTFYDSIRHYLTPENLTLVFVSKDKSFFYLNPDWIYSNTISDFEDLFEKKKGKTIRTIEKSDPSAGFKLSSKEVTRLIHTADALFPLIHGAFGEDGKLTSLIMKRGRKAFLGSSPSVLYESLKKNLSHTRLESLGFPICKYFLINKMEWVRSPAEVIKKIKKFFDYQERFAIVVKPNDCGSSDGVSMVYDLDRIEEAADHAFLFSDEVLIEEKILGREFSIILIEGESPLSLFPTEIVLKKKHEQDAFYSRQKKYMPGSGVEHITPANFSREQIEKIRRESESIFREFGFQDWARFDGFLLPDGSVIWSDLNSIPGIGQDGLLFQQSIYLGIDTYNLCRFVLNRVLKKEGKVLGYVPPHSHRRRVIGVLGGGSTSERQVSRMSWCNVIEKLDRLRAYHLKYLFMDKRNRIWIVPRPYTLKHTTEEIERLIKHAPSERPFPSYETVYRQVRRIFPEIRRQNFLPRLIPIAELKKHIDYLFNCLHGGVGENGTLQKKCEEIGLLYNGSSSGISRLAFDKTHNHVLLSHPGTVPTDGRIDLPEQISLNLNAIKQKLIQAGWTYAAINSCVGKIMTANYDATEKGIITLPDYKRFAKLVLRLLKEQLRHSDGGKIDRYSQWERRQFIIKPAADGCSTGVVVCSDLGYQLPLYLLFSFSRYRFLPQSLFYPSPPVQNYSKNRKNHFKTQEKLIRLPSHGLKKIIFEKFLNIQKGFIEITVGVVGKKGEMISLLPSKTIAELQVLSLDEKFNKGVGPNLTPPRELSSSQIEVIRKSVADFANHIGLKDYARIDLFYHLKRERLYLIEVNTLPGLTAATILFTQALITPGMKSPPSEFLDQVIGFSLPRNRGTKNKFS